MNIAPIQFVRLAIGMAVLLLIASAAAASSPNVPAEAQRDAPEATPRTTEAHDSVRGLFEALTPLEPIQIERLTIVPIARKSEGGLNHLGGHPSVLNTDIVQREKDHAVLGLHNPTSKTVLVTIGRIAYADSLEFVTLDKVVVPPHARRIVEARVIGAADAKLSADPTIRWLPRWVPSGLHGLIAQELKAPDVSLRTLLASDEARAFDDKLAKILHVERFREWNVVGFVAGLDGRAVSGHVFGSPVLHRKKAPGLLGSKALHAWLTEGEGYKPLTGDAASKSVTKKTRDILHTLRSKSRWTHEEQGRFRIEAPGLTGTGILHGGEPVHIALHPHDVRRGLEPEAGS